MKKNILSMAALLMASATVFTGCSNDDNIIDEQPAVTSQQTYTMTIEASKGGDGTTTRALSIDDSGAKTHCQQRRQHLHRHPRLGHQ